MSIQEELVVQSSDMALMNIASLANTGTLDLSPRFQRRNRWKRTQQSLLIESFVINVPVPPIYLAEESRGVFAVIDGKQRLTAIRDFLNGEFALTGLAFRPDLEGCHFNDLPDEVASLLNTRPLRAVMVMRQTADWVKHEVFLRLNTGGQPLNAQEVRNVAFAGPFNDRIIDLSSNAFLRRQLKIISENSSAYMDMTDVETVLRFFAVAERWREFGGSLRGAMDDFMLRHHEDSLSEIDRYARRFERAMAWTERLWGDVSFRRFDGVQWRDQMIGGVFDAQMVAVDETPDAVLERIDSNRRLQSATARMFEDPEFDASVRLSTNTSTRVRYRIQRTIELVHGISA